MKRTISIFLSLLMLLSMTAGLDYSVFAESMGDFEFELLEDNTAIITAYSGTDSVLDIPNTIGEYAVSAIGDNAFYDNEAITEVTIGEGILSIGACAFSGERSTLQRAAILNHECAIGDNAFNSSCEISGYINSTAHKYANENSNNFVPVDECSEHDYDTVITKATTKKNGEIKKVCKICGNTITSTIPCAKDFSLSAESYVYNSSTRKPTVTLKNANGNKISSSNYTVSYADGRKNVGKYSVKVTLCGNYSGTATLYFTIKPKLSVSKSTVAVSEKQTIKVEGTSAKKTFTSSDKSVASVNSKGVITAKSAGTATITVKANGVSNTIKIIVKNPSISLNKTNATVRIKESISLKATPFPSDSKVSWSSSDTSVAKVSSAGKVTGVKKGTCTITAKISYKGKSYSKKCKITVKNPSLNKTSVTVYNSRSTTLEVLGGSGTVTWSSSNKKVARVSSTGKVTGLKKGTCTIYAKRNGFTMKCTVKVSSSYYENKKIPDFGALFGIKRKSTVKNEGMTYVAYYEEDVEKIGTDGLYKYIDVLSAKGFEYAEGDYDYSQGYAYMIFYNSSNDTAVMIAAAGNEFMIIF